MTACIGEPISWPRLEQFARSGGDAGPARPQDPAIAAHLAACAACRQCLAQIRDDVVVLPPLVVPDRPARPVRRRWLAPAIAAAAVVAVAVVVVRRPAPREAGFGAAVTIKGVGDVTLELVRERGGAIAFDAHRYAPGDRWKVVVSCPPTAPRLRIDVSVADGQTIDHPLGAAELACGNRVVVPGAFTISGARPNVVCATVAASPDAEPATACTRLQPE